MLILNSTNRVLPLKFNDNVPTPIVEPEDETESEGRISDKDQIINFETLADTATINKFDDSDNSTFITIDITGRKQHDQSGHLPLYYKCMGQWIWFYKN